jgi:hypothetical protein
MSSPLRRSRADALRIILADRHGELYLDRLTYRQLVEDGWSKSSVDGAIDDLAEMGEVTIIASGSALLVKSLEMVQ